MANRYDEQLGARVLADAPSPAPRLPEKYAPSREPARFPASERAERPVRERPSPPSEAPQAAEPGPAGEVRKSWIRGHPIVAPVGIIALILAAAAGYLYWDYAAHFESTDDAFIAARQFSIAPEVSGYLTAVPVTDNQHVAAGGVIARIDQRQYSIALRQAEDNVTAAEDNIRGIDAQIAVQQANVAQAQAQVEQAQANLVFAQQQATRYDQLSQTGYGSVQNAQQYDSQKLQQQASLKTNQASLVAAERQVDQLKAQRATDEASLAQAKDQRDQAQLNLSYTSVTADQAGRIANLSAAVGEYATTGTSLSMFVPDDIWVTANFKETQLDHMRPGQPVTIEIDAYPDHGFKGHVASFQPGSGTAFSLLPAENATGNYVKIVQRVPVKIIIDNPPADVALGPGMSVDPAVRVNPSPSLFERLRALL
jgi:membrane fusion protein, multidrug efflux system